MRNVTAIHMEPSDSTQLQHISKLKYTVTSQPGERGNTVFYETTRQEMHDFVDKNYHSAYAISRNDDTYAYLEPMDNGHVQYVRTEPDSTRADNLLSLPRY